MGDESTQGERMELSTKSLSGGAQPEFRPVEIATTHELDLTGLNEREAQQLRERALSAKRADVIVNSILGMTSQAGRIRFIRISWGKFGQFPQFIRTVMLAGTGSEQGQEIVKETVSRIYAVEAQEPSE
jgi:hypothetical protein